MYRENAFEIPGGPGSPGAPGSPFTDSVPRSPAVTGVSFPVHAERTATAPFFLLQRAASERVATAPISPTATSWTRTPTWSGRVIYTSHWDQDDDGRVRCRPWPFSRGFALV